MIRFLTLLLGQHPSSLQQFNQAALKISPGLSHCFLLLVYRHSALQVTVSGPFVFFHTFTPVGSWPLHTLLLSDPGSQ